MLPPIYLSVSGGALGIGRSLEAQHYKEKAGNSKVLGCGSRGKSVRFQFPFSSKLSPEVISEPGKRL